MQTPVRPPVAIAPQAATLELTQQAAQPVLLDDRMIEPRKGVFAFMTSTERNGRWRLPRMFRALAVFGNVELDLTQVELGFETDIEVRCLFGNIEILVPAGLRVECDGTATIGNFEFAQHMECTRDESAPIIRIRAGVLLGNIEVVVVDPHARTFLQKIKARWKLRDTNPER